MTSHIQIEVSGTTYPLATDPNTYSEVDIVDFAPRAVSGTPAFSELGIYLDVAQDSFKHGFGRFTFSEPSQYSYSGHQIDTRFGHIQLYTDYTALASLSASIKRLIVHRSTVLMVGSSGLLYALNDAGTGISTVLSSLLIGDILSTGLYFFITQIGSSDRMLLADAGKASSGTGTTITANTNHEWTTNQWASGSGTVYIYEGTGAGQSKTVASNTTSVITITTTFSPVPDSTSRFIVYKNTGNDANPPLGFERLETFGGHYWASERTQPYVHYWDEDTGSDAEGGQATDTQAVRVGPKGIATTALSARIRNMVSFNNQLWVFRDEGAWVIGEDNLAYHTLNFNDQKSNLNFQTVTVWNGFLIFNVKNTLYKYRSGLQDITPPFWDELPPYKQFGNFKGMFARGPFLYVAAQSNVANATDESATEGVAGFVSLLVHDGVGWHKLMDHPSNVAPVNSIFSVALDPVNDYIYMTSNSGVSSNWLRVRLQDLSELPYATYPTTGDHYWYSSYIDLGFKRIPKSLASLTLSGEFPTNTSVVAQYRLDSTTTWTTIGTFDSELEEIDFPADTNGKRIQLRLKFVTSTASSTPIVRAWILKVMIRPDVLYGVTCDVLISDDLNNPDRTQLGLTASEIRTALKAARSSVNPITLTDLYGVNADAYLSSLRFVVVEYENQDNIQAIARCTFVYV